MFRKIIIVMLLSAMPFTLLALKPGDKAPELDVLKWLNGDPVMLAALEGSNIVVLDFWATWLPICRETIPVLSDIQKKYSNDGVVIIGLSTEEETLVSKFVGEHKFIGYRIAVDDAKKTYRKYMGADPGIPAVFVVGKDGVFLWKGHPMELDAVLDKMLKGKFDIKIQKVVTMLHDDLRKAMEKDNPGLISNIADDILEKDPSDDIALRCKLYFFESGNRPREALEFLNKIQKRLPNHFSFYSVELGILDRTGASAEEKKKVYEKVIHEFKDDPDVLANLSMLMSDGMNFGTGSVKLSLEAARRAMEIFPKDGSGRRKGLCLTALARAYYNSGCLEKAVLVQQDAVSSFTGYDEHPQSETILKYYQEACAVNKEILTADRKNEKPPAGNDEGKRE
ncbi:MAG TPA: hypothetical protein DET40_15845 [Lentisphaeria bacterium]|nr:MAG: hypothetical protein A2X45_14370 [Lentisphaerae bacterium GWF2_50_93]HCE45013.1 hypothetical protein [Lentisphaeria bacterium]